MGLPAEDLPEVTEVEGLEDNSATGSTLYLMTWEASEFIRSPSLRILQYTVVALAALTVLCLIIASFIKLDMAVETPGELTSAAAIREVYPTTEGYVSQIDKVIGESVEKGQVIAHLVTGETTESEIGDFSKQIEKIIEQIESSKNPSEIDDRLLVLPAFHTSDTNLSQRLATLEQAQRSLFEQKRFLVAGLIKELDPLVQRKKNLEKTLTELKNSRQKKFMSYYVENTQDEIRKIASQIATTEAQYQNKTDQTFSDFLRELKLTSNGLKTFLESHLIKAPIHGKIVKQLLVQNSRVMPSTSVSSVIPEDAGWIARVKVRAQDIVWLKKGQPMLYKVESYPFERYGLFEGEVLSIDTLREDSTKNDSGFVVTGSIRIPEHLSEERKAEIKMVMGLGLDAKIITGRETILDMILDHIYPSRHHAQ